MTNSKKIEGYSNLSGWSKFTMNTKLIFGLTLTLFLTTILTAAVHVPADYGTIQGAIDAIVVGDEGNTVMVADGTYYEHDLHFNGVLINVRSENGPANCIIDCQWAGRGFYFNNSETPATVVQGFTIINGDAGATTDGGPYGGAIECAEASPTIDNCIIKDNVADFGGAIDCFNASPVIINCRITNNNSYYDGGAIECGSESRPEITNCLIADNAAGGYGGAIDNYGLSQPVIVNCTIVNNTGSSSFGGIYSTDASAIIRNSILWNNGDDIYGSAAVTYSCIQDGSTGVENINTDPLFRTGPLGNYYLSQTTAGQLAKSGCVDRCAEMADAFFGPGHSFTTKTNNQPDTGRLDRGFHYPYGGPIAQYQLTTDVKPNGAGTIDPNYPAPGQYYEQYTEKLITATAAGSYKLLRWIDANSDTYNPLIPSTYHTTPGLNNTFIITLNDANKTVIAEFSPTATYKLISYVIGGNGSIVNVDPNYYPDSNDPGAYFIPKDVTDPNHTPVTITAQPNLGYIVKQWIKGDTATFNLSDPNTYTLIPGSGNSLTTTIDANTTITVEFKYQQYLLTTSVSGGNGTLTPKRGYYPAGTTVQLLATPNDGYRVHAWGKGAANKPAWNTPTNTVLMNATKDVNVMFETNSSRWFYVSGDVNGIQSAIGMARNGDTIQLAAGTYSGRYFYINKVITILGQPLHPENVVIDYSYPTPFYGLAGFELGQTGTQHPIVLNGVTIRNLRTNNSTVCGGGNPGVNGPNSPDHYWGAIRIDGSHKVLNCIVRDCSLTISNACDGQAGGDPNFGNDQDGGNGGKGGDAGGAGITVISGSPIVTNVLIENCSVYGGNGGNGAMGFYQNEPNNSDPINPQFRPGLAGKGGVGGSAFGGGICIQGGAGNPTFTDVIVRNCKAIAGSGGSGANAISGIEVNDIDPAILTGTDPNALNGGDANLPGKAMGGAIFCDWGTSPTFINCSIENCIAYGGKGGDGGDSTDVNTWGGGNPGYGGLTTLADAGQGDLRLITANGGAVFCDFASYPTFISCSFTGNMVYGSVSGIGGQRPDGLHRQPWENMRLPANGAGVMCDLTGVAIFEKCHFENNKTAFSGDYSDSNYTDVIEFDDANALTGYDGEYTGIGGGICMLYPFYVDINDCNFIANQAPIGAGIYGLGVGSEIHIKDSNIVNNISYSGGGVMLLDSIGSITKSLIKGNAAGTLLSDNMDTGYALYGTGGGIYAISSLIDIHDTTVTENSARITGGGICFDGYWWPQPTLKPSIKNCLVTKNTASEEGGGIAAVYLAKLIIQNCTIAENHTTDVNSMGSGLFAAYMANVTVKDSILWQNGLGNSGVDGSQIALSSYNSDMPASLKISYSDIQTKVLDANLHMDIVIVIDTTGSMSAVLDSIKSAAGDIVDRIAQKMSDYRIAVVDYRDFPVVPYGVPGLDYTFKDDIAFTTNRTAIQDAINAITLGSGNDWRESVYSALMHCVDGNSLGNWRSDKNVKKLIILMGDAPGHDPCEPYGNNYTLANVINAASNKNIDIYSILTGSGVGNTQATDNFRSLAEGTGGVLIETPDGSTASAAVIQAIDMVTLPSTYIYLDDQMCSITGLVQGINDMWSVEGSTNISEDPNFVADYYLSHIATGQNIDSVCIDAGSTTATALGLGTYTTRIDGIFDTGLVDMGYHHKIAMPQYDITVKIIPDANDPGIYGYITTADPNNLVSYDVNTATYKYRIYEGVNLTLTAVSDINHYVRGWYDQNDVLISTDQSFTFSASANKAYFVRFKPIRYNVTVKVLEDSNYPGIHGHITANPNNLVSYDAITSTYTYRFSENTTPVLTAVPDTNYFVSGWFDSTDTKISNSDSIILTVNSNKTYYVRFKQERIISVSGGGAALRNAVNNAQNGDKLIVAAGTYSGDIDIAGKQIKLYGVNPDDPNVVARTIIDCINNSRGFVFAGGETHNTIIDGFTIINGGNIDDVNSNVYGGAIFIDVNSSPLIVNIDIRDCAVRTSGGAIYIDTNSIPEFRNVDITNCRAQTGGGVYISNNSNPIFKDCSIERCSASPGSGGGVYCVAGNSPLFERCTFTSNTAATYAGAIFYDNFCTVLLGDCKFSGNSAQLNGGAVMCSTTCTIEVNDCNFADNQADYAGAIYIAADCNGRIFDTNMSGNTAREDGGAIYIIDSNVIDINNCGITDNTALRGGGIFALESPTVTIAGCRINSNRARRVLTYYIDPNDPNSLVEDDDFIGQGGGIYAFASIERVANCQITSNMAKTSGGGLYIAGPQDDVNYPFVFNCLITKNSAERDGGGLSINWYAEPAVKNCTIVENSASFSKGFGGGIACSYNSEVNVTNSIIWNNIGANGSQLSTASGDPSYELPSTINISYSDIRDYNETGIEEIDPTQEAIRPGFDDHSLAANDDSSTDVIDAGFEMNFFGTKWSTLYVNNNGNITFDAPLFTFTPFALTSNLGTPIIAPFFADVDTTDANSQLVTYAYGEGVIDGHNAFGVNWINVGYFNSHSDKLNSFQLILIDRSDRNPGDFDIEFNYGRILWETGDASGGTNGFGGSSARAGFSNGTGLPGSFFEVEGSGVNGAFLDSNPTGIVHRNFNSPVVGRMQFKVVNGLPDLGGTPIYIDPNCSIPNWTPGTHTWAVASHNIKSDPNFVFGYYLSHSATGQTKDSNCIDKGKETAATIGLGNYTTSINGTLEDGSIVDMGYHYLTAASTSKLRVKLNGIGGTYDINPKNVIVSSTTDPCDVNTYTVYNGATVHLTAKPADGFYLKAWFNSKNQVASYRNDYELTINKDTNVSVEFRQGQTIQVSGGANALRQAVDNAQNGDTLIVAAGTYAGDIDIGGKQIKLFGVKPDNSNVTEKTIIDCGTSKRGFTFNSGETANTIIDGFTIINAGGDVNDTLSGAAIYIDANSSPTIVNVNIQNCTIYNANGAAIYIGYKCGPSLTNVNISNCQVYNGNGGAIFISTEADPVFIDCSVKNCRAFGGSGGAAYCSIKSMPSFTDCSFTNNSANISAGAVYCHVGCRAIFSRCDFSNNSALLFIDGQGVTHRANGGGIYYSRTNVIEVDDCNFTGNTAGSGAAVFADTSCTGIFKNITFNANSADNDGGAIYIIDSNVININDCVITGNTALRGGGIFALESPKVRIAGCEINANRAYGSTQYRTDPNDPNTLILNENFVAQGGGIFAFASIEQITGCSIASNTALTSGGGIYIAGDQENINCPRIFNCLITKNKAGLDGGGISVNWFATAKIQNCTIAENIATGVNGNGGGLYCSYAAQTNVNDTIFWANTGIEGSQIAVGSGDTAYPLPGTVNVTYSDVDLRIGAAFDSLDIGSGTTSTSSNGSVLVDQTTIYNQISSTGSAKVIVSLVEPAGKSQITDWSNNTLVEPVRAQIAALQNQVLSTLNTSEFTLRHKLTNVTTFSGQVTQAGIDKLLANPTVAHIEPVKTFYPELAQGLPLMNAITTRETYNGGTGTAIAIVDTGVDYTHSKLGGGTFPNYKVIGGYDTGNNDNNPMPVGEAHGTCCAGIAAGSLGTVGDYIGGVAPNAKIYALKASPDNAGLFYNDAILAAWDWCISHKNDDPQNPILVISNSLGGGSYNNHAAADADNPALAAAVKTANAAGITILASSGNDAYTNSIAAPAALSNVISVGAVYDAAIGTAAFSNCTDAQTAADKVTCYSNTAAILDMLAPSHNAYTTDIAGTGGYSSGDYDSTFGGTSAACPYAAGAVAALQSAAKQLMHKYLTPDEIRTLLTATGDSTADTKAAIAKPRINLGAATTMLTSSVPIYVEHDCILTGYVYDNNEWVVDANEHNLGKDPNFVFGYYLSHKDAGQDYNSPCFDIGPDSAASLGLNTLTTRADNFKDTGPVDLGYHYSQGVKQFNLTITVDVNDANGTTNPTPGSPHPYYDGEVVKIEAIPGVKSRVKEWIIDHTTIVTNNRYQNVTMDRAHNVTVVFEFYEPANLIVPDQYGTIQEAINAAEDGDTVYVYRKSNGNPHYISDVNGLDFKGKAITIRSENPNDPNIVAATVIDCNNRGRAFIFRNGETADSNIYGLTITNGLASGPIADGHTIIYDPCDANIYYSNGMDAAGDGFGGAIYIDANTSPTIRNCVFMNCQVTGGQGADGERGYNLSIPPQAGLTRGGRGGDGGNGSGNGFGAVIFCDTNSSPNINSCTFKNNIAKGGIGGNAGDGGNGTISNLAGDGGDGGNGFGNGFGGVIYFATKAKPKLLHCTFSSNAGSLGVGGTGGRKGVGQISTQPPYSFDGFDGYSSGQGFGGAIYYEQGATADINDCTFLDNSIHADNVFATLNNGGGAIYFEPKCESIKIIKSNISANRATTGSGGAILLGANNDITLISCYFGGNTANENGGALAIGSEIDAGNCDLNFDNCTFTNNTAGNWGGGIYAKNFDADFNDCYINRNTASSGGGLHLVAHSTLKLTGGSIMQNKAIGQEAEGGGALILHLKADIINCQISGNTSQYAGGGIMFKGEETTGSNVINCLFTQNSAAARGGAILTTLYSLPNILSCTFSQNETEVGGAGGAIFCSYYGSPTIKDCIFDKTKRVAIYANSIDALPVISYCLFNKNYHGDFYSHQTGITYDTSDINNSDVNLAALNLATDRNNIAGDPCFASGALGDYYLRQKPADGNANDINSPAVDAGSDDAIDISVLPGKTTMANYTTRTDSIKPDSLGNTNDQGILDIGFHYMDPNAVAQYKLTTAVIGGHGSIEPLTGSFYAGTTVKLTALPDTGWRVNKWSGTDDDSTSNTTNYVVMDVNKTVTVSFEQPNDLYVPGEYTTIQDAINSAKNGDKIIISSGTYQYYDTNFDFSAITIRGKNITITGTNPDDPCVVASTIILSSRFDIRDVDQGMILDGVTIQDAHYGIIPPICPPNPISPDGINGGSLLGGAMLITNASPIIRNVRFVDCSASGGDASNNCGGGGDGGWGGYARGGAVGIGSGSNPIFKNCQFINCYVQGGNGGNGDTSIQTPGHGGSWGDPNGDVDHTWDNADGRGPNGGYAPYWFYSGYGGAIYCSEGSKPQFENCLFRGNRTYGGLCGLSAPNMWPWPINRYVIDSFGGAVYLAAGSEAEFTGCTFSENQADTRNQIGDSNTTYPSTDWVLSDPVVSYGGAICAEGTTTPVVKGCTFTNNIACAGGSMYWEDSVAHISKSKFEGSIAMLGGGILLMDSDSIIFDCNFVNNQAVDPAGQGGAIYCASSAAKFYDCKIQYNQASASGGGAYFSGEFEPNMHNCLITNNTSGRDGAGISANWDVQLTLSNCTIANNLVVDNNSTIIGYGGGLSCAYDAYAKVINSIIWNNNALYGQEISIGSNFDAADKRKAEVRVSYSDVKDGAAGVFADYAHGCVLDWNDVSNLSGTNLANPWFVNGPFGGNYYLSQRDANDANYSNTHDSNCVNAGFGTAIANDMYRHTTRTDLKLEVDDPNDANKVNMGYHYTLTADIVGDFDFDGNVDFVDFAAFMDYWMQDNCTFPYSCHERDITEDGEVDFMDYALFAENYGAVEKIPPQPDPMTWALRPRSAGPTLITMTATTARDSSGSQVKYKFECTSGGGHDSNDWEPNSRYTDTGLVAGRQYGYRVKARDALLNETGWSVIGYAVAGEDTTPPWPDPMTWATTPPVASPNSIQMVAADACDISGVEYYFDCTSPGCHDSNSWQNSPVYEDTGLDPNTAYTYRVKARDKSPVQNETRYSIPLLAITLAAGQGPIEPNVTDVNAPTPDPSEWLVTPFWYKSGSYYYHTMTAVTAADASPPILYYFECITNSDLSSDWQEESTYTTTKMTAVSHAAYRVWTMDSLGHLSGSSLTYHTLCGYGTYPCAP